MRELGTGKSRKEVLEGLGIKVTVCPNIPVADGIQAVRMLLPTCWFDKTKCKDGIEALRMYRRALEQFRSAAAKIKCFSMAVRLSDRRLSKIIGNDNSRLSHNMRTGTRSCGMERISRPR